MIRAILTDIEGTTSSLAFVKTVLFPYAAEHLPDYVRAHAGEPPVAEQLDAVRQLAREPAADTERVIAILQDWMRADSKATPLKALQGMVWKHGYRSGAYRAHIYPDAVAALRDWHLRGLPLYVYSSGSVAAQKLFFRHCEAGDLSGLFSAYFDTGSGPKQDPASYTRIVAAMGLPAAAVLFLSDVPAELDAARAAGLQTVWLVRPQDSAYTAADVATVPHRAVSSFADVQVN